MGCEILAKLLVPQLFGMCMCVCGERDEGMKTSLVQYAIRIQSQHIGNRGKRKGREGKEVA